MIAMAYFLNTFNNINTFDIIKKLIRVSRFSALLTPSVGTYGVRALTRSPLHR